MINNLLVCIGAQKAGTSWLHTILKKDIRFSHVSQQFPYVKEIHYFDHFYDESTSLIDDWRAHYLIELIQEKGLSIKRPIQDCLQHTLRKTMYIKYASKEELSTVERLNILTTELDDYWYEDLLRCTGEQVFALDITPDYSIIGSDGFSHMKRITKNLKILFILRDPIERAWSGILQGKKDLPGGVESFVEGNDFDIDDLYKRCTVGLDVGARTNYLRILEDVVSAGVKEDLKIVFYDDISHKPEGFIDSIYDFIGLDNNMLKTNEYINELAQKIYATDGKKSVPIELETRLLLYYRKMLTKMQEEYDIVFPAAWIEKYQL